MHKTFLTLLLITTTLLTSAMPQSDIDQALQMLADFTPYMCQQYQPIDEKNSRGELLATFKGENTFGNNEQGVRHNADLSMVCAFLCKYAKGKVELPAEVSWEMLADMARRTLAYSYSTHKANRLFPCKGNQYWGSTSRSDVSWESSLWAMSVAYSAFFQWENLSAKQRDNIYKMLKAECNYELERDIPTNVVGDTKAEENGWECNVLAVTLGLFPKDKLAPQWFERLRQFAINSYSHPSDKDNKTVIDPDYDSKTVADLFVGANLYDDYTLQNHNYFHTSYQNVVAQELGEAALALKLFQRQLHNTEQWHTNALMHNIAPVMQKVLYPLALPDGELAMPNGNDWSLFLYDQLTSYSTAACFLRDPHALMLEQRALQQIARRQKTTKDGSWLLRADVGARRMGVEAHRVMMSWLMHHVLPTDGILSPTLWTDFAKEYSAQKYFESQDIIVSSTPDRFFCFSWSKGLKSYTGYFAPNNAEQNNIVVPYRANGTGNFFGTYDIEGKPQNATDISHGWSDNAVYGTLYLNDNTLCADYSIIATTGNLILYVDQIKAQADCKINKEKWGMLALSTDPFTKTSRVLRSNNGTTMESNGLMFLPFNSTILNVDETLGILNVAAFTQTPKTQRSKSKVQSSIADHKMAFGEQANNNSILTSKLYTSYDDQPREVKQGETVAQHIIAYYSNVTSLQTAKLASKVKPIDSLGNGWQGFTIEDTNGDRYLIIYNSTQQAQNTTLPQTPTPLLPQDLKKLEKKLKPTTTITISLSEHGKTVVTQHTSSL